MSRKVAATAVAVAVGLPTAATAQQPPEPAAHIAVVSTTYVHPKRVRFITTAFEPWSTPTPAQVRTIIAVEAAKWGASAGGLANRIGCESGFDWNAVNGQYSGLGQFASSTFYRGMSSIGTRKVRLVTRRERVKRVRRLDTMSDGTIRGTPRWAVRQRIVHIYSGKIPASPPPTHGWAQVRIMAQALTGRSAVSNSEWQCGA